MPVAFLALLLVLLLNGWTAHIKPERFVEELPRAFAASRGAVGGTRDLMLVGFGLRRLAGDFAMVDLIVYYGSREEAGHEWHHASGWGQDTGMYRDLLPLAKRILGLDPFFRYAVLYAATALAFNEARDQEAVELLEQALKRDEKYWPYSLNLSSIAYKKTKNYPQLITLVEQMTAYPECPAMLKNILGNIYLKTGQLAKALSIFEWMAQYAPEADYREIAGQKLERYKK